MPPQTPAPASQPVSAPQPTQVPQTSRRSVLRGVAGIGVVGVAAAIGAGAAVAIDKPGTLKPASKKVMAPMEANAIKGPIVIYIADTTTGVFDAYGGTGGSQIRNPALVKQILANIKSA